MISKANAHPPSRWYSIREALLDLVFPPHCAMCGSSTAGADLPKLAFCNECLSEIHLLKDPVCGRCALPLITNDWQQGDCCPQCKDESWAFDQAIALGAYNGLLRHLILQGKHRSGEIAIRGIADMLAPICDRKLKELGHQDCAVAPIPSHWRRRFARRSNSPDWICDQLAKQLGLPKAKGLSRVVDTKRQTQVAPSQRVSNVRGAFRVAKNQAFQGKTVLLVDDVLTTGATLSTAARELKRAGAVRVVAVVVARRLGAQGRSA